MQTAIHSLQYTVAYSVFAVSTLLDAFLAKNKTKNWANMLWNLWRASNVKSQTTLLYTEQYIIGTKKRTTMVYIYGVEASTELE